MYLKSGHKDPVSLTFPVVVMVQWELERSVPMEG